MNSAARTQGSEPPPTAPIDGSGDWSEAFERGALIKRRIIDTVGGVLRCEDVAERLGISTSSVEERRRTGELVAVRTSADEWAYPDRQFTNQDQPHTGLQEVIAAFPVGTDPWIIVSFLTNPVPGHEEGVAFDSLSDPDAVAALVELARTYGEQGAT